MFSRTWYYWCLLLGFLALHTSQTAHQVSAQPIFFTAQDPDAFDALIDEDGDILIERERGAYWSFIPKDFNFTNKVGIVYHPGAYYDERAYAPILREMAEAGYPAFLLDVPVSFSILAPFRADLVMREYPQIETWVVAGHGLGGMVASLYTQFRRSKYNIEGLALFSAAPCPLICNLKWTDIKAISLWGNQDGITTQEKWEGGASSLPDDAKFVEIDGGNNSQMSYLSTTQTNDGDATITQDTQQAIVQTELKTLLAAVQAEI